MDKFIYEKLKEASHQWLDHFGIPHEPHKPKIRIRKWNDGIGPIGVAYHYTGGPSGLKSCKWMNHPNWGNNVSSCHVIIFDRNSGETGKVWNEVCSPELLYLFPVPTIILADWRWGTWGTNWANPYTLNVEMVNCGYNIKKNNGLYNVKPKIIMPINGQYWEAYTQEQMISAINIGRLTHILREDVFDPDWVIGHQCVWATKSDPGPAFPIHFVRRAIVENQVNLPWINFYQKSILEKEDDKVWFEIKHELRDDDSDKFWENEHDGINNIESNEAFSMEQSLRILFDLGYNIYNSASSRINQQSNRCIKFIKWFQKSTHAYFQPQNHLKIDGIVGPKTMNSLIKRIGFLYKL